jgi:hypothetical protein
LLGLALAGPLLSGPVAYRACSLRRRPPYHRRPHRPVAEHSTFVGGHLTRLGTRDDVTIQQAYVAELKAAAADAIDSFNIDSVYASVDDTNPWAVFRGYLDGVAAQAAHAVVPRWIDKLGGADVYTQSNAYQLAESLRIDYGHLGPFGIHP